MRQPLVLCEPRWRWARGVPTNTPRAHLVSRGGGGDGGGACGALTALPRAVLVSRGGGEDGGGACSALTASLMLVNRGGGEALRVVC